MKKSIRRVNAGAMGIIVLFLGAVCLSAQVTPSLQEWMRRLGTSEFAAARGGSGRWVDGGAAYLATERNTAGVAEIIRYDTATGKRDVWMSAEKLTPPHPYSWRWHNEPYPPP